MKVEMTICINKKLVNKISINWDSLQGAKIKLSKVSKHRIYVEVNCRIKGTTVNNFFIKYMVLKALKLNYSILFCIIADSLLAMYLRDNKNKSAKQIKRNQRA